MSRKNTILLVDDEPTNLKVLVETLKALDYELLTTTSGERALYIAQEAKPDLILLDVNMPKGIDGFETCLKIKYLEETKDIPVIFISALDDVDVKVKGFEVGGIDYITKPFYQDEVVARVETHLKISQLTRELKIVNNRLLELSIRDPLTNLYNRRYFFDRLEEEEIKRSMRQNESIAIAIFDIDSFKSVNDTYGHLCGDFMLKKLSALLREQIRETDLLARYGGEEFIAAFLNIDSDGIDNRLERLRALVESHVFVFEGIEIKRTISIGFTARHLTPHSRVKIQDLVDEADRALYHAKATGKNRGVFFADLSQVKSKELRAKS